MPFRIFSIPIFDNGTLQAEMNGFLRAHRVLSIKQRWVEQGGESVWCFCVDYLDHSGNANSGGANAGVSKPRTDYKELLKPDDFGIFAELRDWRKETAQREAVPVYTIFTNDQLAQMVQSRIKTMEALKKIVGIGDARVAIAGQALAALTWGRLSSLPNLYSKVAYSFQREAYRGAGFPAGWKACPTDCHPKESMNRVGHLFEAVVSRDNLRAAFWKASKGKRHRDEVRRFAAHLENRLADMAKQLCSGQFPLGRFHQFVIHDPKERIITAPCLPERILHHAIVNVCEPHFERWLIPDTYACRKGRGRLKALAAGKVYARRHQFFVKFDIRKYFDSIAHETLLSQLRRRFKDARLLSLLARIVRAYRGGLGRGLPIGSLMSQHLANFYLDRFDRFVKENLRLPGYVRYMDDMAIWGNDSRALLELAQGRCGTFLQEELQLQYKAPPYGNRTARGMDFLGVRVFGCHLTLNGASKRRFSRRLRVLEQCHALGRISEAELQQRATALTAYCRAGTVSSWKFRQSVLSKQVESSQKARTG